MKIWTLSAVSAISLIVVCVDVMSISHAATSETPKQTITANTGEQNLDELQRRRDALFQRMFADPSNLDVAFEYAALSVRVGDAEAAISTLERMLIYAPGLPRLQLELGLLYYRVSAFQTARSYFVSVLSAPDLPEEVRIKAEQYLAGIDTASDPNDFSGQVRAGIRFQTNANRATTESNITLNGNVFALTPGSTGESDFNVYAAGALHWRHELESQGDAFEIDLLAYGSKQFERQEIDLLQAELTAGPSFDLGRWNIDNAALGIYGITSGVYLGQDFYSAAYGAGTRLVFRPSAADLISLKAEYRQRKYFNSTGAPTATDRNGHEARVQANFRHIINQNLAITTNARFQRSWAAEDYLSYSDFSAGIGPVFGFNSPFGDDKPDWIGTITVGGAIRSYDEPDATINVNIAQRDREGFISAAITAPIKSGWAALAETEYRVVQSNYPTRDHDNFTVSFSFIKNW